MCPDKSDALLRVTSFAVIALHGSDHTGYMLL